MKRNHPAAAIAVFVLLTFAAPAAASFPGYSVVPAYGSGGTPAPDLAPVGFWDLSLREMALVAALTFCPAVVVPVEIFFILKIYAYFGFRRISRGNILENGTRNDIYRIIRETPGIRFPALREQTGISRGALTYHLAILTAGRKIVAFRINGSTGYLENNGKFSCIEQKVLSCLGHRTERRILHLLFASPGCSRSDIEKELAVSGPTVSWYMKRLDSDGILRREKDGRYSRYSLTGEASVCLGRFSGIPPGCDAMARPAEVPSASF